MRSIFVIEARQGDGKWKPVAGLAEGPFTKGRAKRRLREFKDEHPHMKHLSFRRRIRIREYVPVETAVALSKMDAEED